MKKPCILIIENSIDVTGALKSITRTAYDLKEWFDFIFIIPKGSKGRAWIEGKGFVNIHELSLVEISRRFVSLLLYIPCLFINVFRVSKIVRQNDISIIHVNDLYNILPVILHMFGKRIPYVCHMRFLPDRFPPWLFNFWLRLHLRYAKKIIAVSYSVSKQLPQHSKIIVIHNELPVEERYPELTELNSKREAGYFLYLSNYINGKGQNYALEAFAAIHTALPKWKLRFVGGDMGLEKNRHFKAILQERAKKIGISEKVEWEGFTEEVEREYKQADIVLNFSESESFSITCLEALFFSRPVIASKCGGPEEIIVDGETGILVGNRNLKEMADAMKILAENEQFRIKMGRQGSQSVRVKFSLENTSYKLMEVYNEALSN